MIREADRSAESKDPYPCGQVRLCFHRRMTSGKKDKGKKDKKIKR